MSDLKNNPHYLNGVYIGTGIGKHIENTTYGTLEEAIRRKEELVVDLKEQLEYDETHKDVAETLGIIAALKHMQSTEQSNQPEHQLSHEDIVNVAVSIGLEVTEDQSTKILNAYQSAQENDPTATWELVVEHLIHEVNNGNI